MIVATRHRVDPADARAFLDAAAAALAALAARKGFLDGSVGRALDDAGLWTVVTRWQDVGSYRRALGSIEVKTVAVPLLSTALDEPSAFEVLHAVGPGPGPGVAGGPGGAVTTDAPSALAADAGSTRLGEAAAPFVATDLDR